MKVQVSPIKLINKLTTHSDKMITKYDPLNSTNLSVLTKLNAYQNATTQCEVRQ